jgi:hypothetical protein
LGLELAVGILRVELWQLLLPLLLNSGLPGEMVVQGLQLLLKQPESVAVAEEPSLAVTLSVGRQQHHQQQPPPLP